MILNINTQSTVVFDLDDTLYNELDYLKSAYLSLAKKLDTHQNIILYARMLAMYRNKENVFQFLSENYSVPVETLIHEYRNHVPKIVLFDYVEALFLAIKKEGGKIAVITDGRSITQRNKINQLGIAQYLDLIIISEEIGTEKPDLNNFKKVEKDLKTKNNTYIADNLRKDFIAPNYLGWNSICLVDNGKNIHKNKDEFYGLKENKPKEFILNFNEINIFPFTK